MPATLVARKGVNCTSIRRGAVLMVGLIVATAPMAITAANPPPPSISSITVSNQQKRISWTPYPATQQYKMFRTDLVLPWVEDTSGTVSGFEWAAPLGGGLEFHKLQAVPMSDNDLLTANVLNRLAYGSTPDELERVRAIGADAFIQEQLAPELISENLAVDSVTTNFGSGWQLFTATGTATSTNLYIYLNVRGDCFIDDIRVVAGTNAGVGLNLVRNGDFELGLSTNDWVISPNHAGSAITTAFSQSGGGSLHVVASSGGTTQGSAIWQAVLGISNGAR